MKNTEIDFETAKFIFAGQYAEYEDTRSDYGETRIIAFGTVEGTDFVVVHTWREDSRRLISARRANERERKAYRSAFPHLNRSG